MLLDDEDDEVGDGGGGGGCRGKSDVRGGRPRLLGCEEQGNSCTVSLVDVAQKPTNLEIKQKTTFFLHCLGDTCQSVSIGCVENPPASLGRFRSPYFVTFVNVPIVPEVQFTVKETHCNDSRFMSQRTFGLPRGVCLHLTASSAATSPSSPHTSPQRQLLSCNSVPNAQRERPILRMFRLLHGRRPLRVHPSDVGLRTGLKASPSTKPQITF